MKYLFLIISRLLLVYIIYFTVWVNSTLIYG